MSCDCSTTERESESSTDQGTEQLPVIYPLQGAATILLLYTGTMMRDLASGTALYVERIRHSTTHTEPTQHQLQSSTREDALHALHRLCLVSEISFITANVSLPQP